ncbi:hypothetical protein LIER_32111 [Lithospermum erythrorhizon]|uniref:Uncharacterized protein n=1 Tax=Lithospermum erythrorhizon TaxID=34254 RepID=A0AAV3RUQ8_LITER
MLQEEQVCSQIKPSLDRDDIMALMVQAPTRGHDVTNYYTKMATPNGGRINEEGVVGNQEEGVKLIACSLLEHLVSFFVTGDLSKSASGILGPGGRNGGGAEIRAVMRGYPASRVGG